MINNNNNNNQCFMKPLKRVEVEHPMLFFFDFETKVDERGNLVPFYCVVQKVCSLCDGTPFVRNFDHFLPHPQHANCDLSVDSVECCGYRQYVFERDNESVVPQLVEFMLQQRRSVRIAHNGGRFDTIFLFRHLMLNNKLVPESVAHGNQIMCITIAEANVKIIDSYLFLAMPLRDVPKAMGIENLTNGYHPYKFTDLRYSAR